MKQRGRERENERERWKNKWRRKRDVDRGDTRGEKRGKEDYCRSFKVSRRTIVFGKKREEVSEGDGK